MKKIKKVGDFMDSLPPSYSFSKFNKNILVHKIRRLLNIS